MAAKRKAVGLLVALAALLLAAPAFASIPRSPLLDPPRLTIELDPPADVAQDERETPLHHALASALAAPEPIEHEQCNATLRRALSRALPASAPLASLAETRIRASDFFAPLFHQSPEPLSRALHQAYARLNGESASDRLFAGSDPINRRDPTGRCWVKNAERLMRLIADTERIIVSSGSWDVKLGSTVTELKQELHEILASQDTDKCTDDELVSFHSSKISTELAALGQKYAGLEDEAERLGQRVWHVDHPPMDPSLVAEGADVRQQIAANGEKVVGDITGRGARIATQGAKAYGEGKLVEVAVIGVGRLGTSLGEIAWSSKSVRDAVKALEAGATEVRVASRSEAEELFLRRYQSEGYRNVTGMSPRESKEFFGGKSGTYHWDVGEKAYPHGQDHLQVHTRQGQVVRIYFP